MTGLDLDAASPSARAAWESLRDRLRTILGEDLVAMWAYGGTITAPKNASVGDLDTVVVVRGPVDTLTAAAIDEAEAGIARDGEVEWDSWYLRLEDARGGPMPRHAWRDRLSESWAIDRAHWLAGRYAHLHGVEPAQLVAAPTAEELDEALRAEVAHLERHVDAGDTDPYEATYALLNGSRILHAVETGHVAISKREAGRWALGSLPERWHPALLAASRSYEQAATVDDEALLAREMEPFVAFVSEAIRSSTQHRPEVASVGSTTAGTEAAKAAGITFRAVRTRPAGSAEESADLQGIPLGALVRTLVVRRAEDDYLFVLVPGGRRFDWPKLRAHLGVKRMTMPDAEEARAVTGYERGAITPFGSARAWPVIADATVLAQPVVAIGGGARGVNLHLAPADLVATLDATVADVSVPDPPTEDA